MEESILSLYISQEDCPGALEQLVDLLEKYPNIRFEVIDVTTEAGHESIEPEIETPYLQLHYTAAADFNKKVIADRRPVDIEPYRDPTRKPRTERIRG